MKSLSPNREVGAFTLLELLVILAILAVMAAMLLPALDGRPTHAPRHQCLNQLHQIGSGFAMFAGDNGGLFPAQCSITNCGSKELISSNNPALHYRVLAPFVGNNIRVWVCPADESRTPSLNSANLDNTNLSYFYGVDAVPTAGSAILAGDRNLESLGQPVKSGLFVLTTKVAVGWTAEMHSKRMRVRCGNVLFADGHVENIKGSLSATIQRQGIATNRLAMP